MQTRFKIYFNLYFLFLGLLDFDYESDNGGGWGGIVKDDFGFEVYYPLGGRVLVFASRRCPTGELSLSGMMSLGGFALVAGFHSKRMGEF